MDLLNTTGIKTKATKQGLDRRVWACFKGAFNPQSNPLTVPVIQASHFDTEDPHQHYSLCRALSSLRAEIILIIVSGMAVNNLRDFQLASLSDLPLPYTLSFDEALKGAVTADPVEREGNMVASLKRKDARGPIQLLSIYCHSL